MPDNLKASVWLSWQPARTAFIAADEAISADTLNEHCRKHLAPYRIPSRYVVTDELPKTSSGKLDKPVLLEQLAANLKT